MLFRFGFLLSTCVILCSTAVDGALIVYEGFQGYGSQGSVIGTPLPNSNTVGLDRTLAYRSTGWKISAGLTFGSLLTTGDAVSFTSAEQTYLSSKLDLDQNPANTASFAGTLYSSYLVNMTSLVANGGIQLRVSDAFSSTDGTRFFADADTRQLATTNAGVAYNNSAATSTNRDLGLNTTYLVIGRYTNVGTPLSPTVQGIGSLFVLTQDQFAYMTTLSDWEAYLDDPSRGIGSNADQIFARASTAPITSATYYFDDSDFVHFLAVAGGSFDEFRFGSDIYSVLPIAVPEPSRMLGLLTSMLLIMNLRRAR